jgi:nucleoside 2-deoxyribosyltransferase
MEERYKIYLAGPMRGIAEFNFPAFRDGAKRLREMGYEVFSPAERDEAEGFDPTRDTPKSMDYYMRFDLPEVCRADAVAVLPGWEMSQGATLEVHVARKLGKEILSADTAEPIDRPLVSGTELRKEVLADVAKCVCADRQNTYGDAEDNFAAIADVCNIVLKRKLKESLSSIDVAAIMLAVKLCRMATSPEHADNWIDAAGYAVCGAGILKRKALTK